MYKHTSGEVLQGQVTYLVNALENILVAALTEFYFRDHDYLGNSATKGYYSYWEDASVATTNFWQIANLLRTYSAIAIFSIAFITQLLAMLGIAASVNSMVWIYGVFTVFMSINVIYMLLMGYGYDLVNKKVLAGDANAIIVQG